MTAFLAGFAAGVVASCCWAYRAKLVEQARSFKWFDN